MKIKISIAYGYFSFLLPLLVYIATTARTITSYGDSAELATMAYKLETAHPPGYPLYIILGKLFTFLPFGSIAFRLNLMSGFFGALTVFFVFKILKKLELPPFSAFLSSLALAFSYSFWLYSTISEVFVLNNFIGSVIIYLLLDFREKYSRGEKGGAIKTLYFMAFFYGLGLSNHTSIILLFPAALYLIYATDKKIIFRHLLGLFFVFILGLIPYLHVIWSSLHHHYPAYGNLPGMERFFQYVTRSDYGGIFSAGSNSGVTPTDYWGLFLYYLKLLFSQLTPLAPLIALYFMVKSFLKKQVLFIFLSILFLTTAVIFPMYALKGNDATDFHTLGVSERLPQLGFVMLSITSMLGLHSFLINSKSGAKTRLYQGILILLVLFLLITNYPRADKSSYNLAKNYALNILNQIESNSIIITSDDMTDFSLLYFTQVEKIKPNVSIINIAFMNSKWYQKELKKTWPDLYKTDSVYIYNVARDIIATNQGKRNVYFVMLDDPYPLGFDANPYYFTPMGLILKADESSTPDSVKKASQTDYWQQYNLSDLKKEYDDPFARLTKNNYPFRHKINAKVYLRAGCLECAKKELQDALKISPDDISLQSTLDTLSLSNPTPVKKTAKDYIQSARNFIQAQGFKFDLNIHRAIIDTQQGLKLDPKNEEAYGILGELYEYFGDYKYAINEYEDAYKINPKELDWKVRANTIRHKAPKESLQ